METSIFLAKFWGWYLLIFFFILSVNPKRIRQIIEDLKDQKFIILAAFIAIIVGLLNILAHNIWEANWTIVVTLIGWIALSIGLALFAFPKASVKQIEILNLKLIQVLYMLLFLVGIYLLNMAYQVVPL